LKSAAIGWSNGCCANAADGGWNCEAERGSVRFVPYHDLCAEGLLAFEQAFGASPPVTEAQGCEEYLLERRLLEGCPLEKPSIRREALASRRSGTMTCEH
jgi:hypothetical protein